MAKTAVIIFLLLTGMEACNVTICLTWIVTKSRLMLSCRVDKLQYRVTLYKEDVEEAYCVMPQPSPKCKSYNKVGNITQNVVACETRLVITDEIDTKFDGQWTCAHGRNRDIVSVNVTVFQSKGETSSPSAIKEDERIRPEVIKFTMVPYFLSCFTLWLICVVTGCCKNSDNYLLKKVQKFISKSKCHKILSKEWSKQRRCVKAGTVLLTWVMMCSLPFVPGISNETLISLSVLSGILNVLILTLRESDNIEHDQDEPQNSLNNINEAGETENDSAARSDQQNALLNEQTGQSDNEEGTTSNNETSVPVSTKTSLI